MPALRSNITREGVKFTSMILTFPLCCPGMATIRHYYEQRLHALDTCSVHAGAGSCVEAEDAPLLAAGIAP